MIKNVLKIIPTIYGIVSALCFVGLYCLTLLERGGEVGCTLCLDKYVFEPFVLLTVLMSHAVIIALINIGRPGEYFYWPPLLNKQNAISVAKIILYSSFIFFVLNVFYGVSMLGIDLIDKNGMEKGYFALPIFYSLMTFYSLIIPLSFLVGLSNIAPKWIVSLYDFPFHFIFSKCRKGKSRKNSKKS